MHRWIAVAGDVATRVLPALVVAVGCLGAVAYAATGPVLGEAGDPGESRRELRSRTPKAAATARPPRPLITRHPKKVSLNSTASFTFRVRRAAGFQCRLDRGGWRGCRPPLVLRGLDPGDHSFSVRAVSRHGRPGPAARFGWKLLEPKPFSIEPRLSSVSALYPGAAPLSLPLLLRNPNPAPIFVTKLTVAATADPPGCDSSANLALIPSGASPATPLALPPGGSASLPAAGVSAPGIALRDLPFNQDACQGARFPLSFSGKARG